MTNGDTEGQISDPQNYEVHREGKSQTRNALFEEFDVSQDVNFDASRESVAKIIAERLLAAFFVQLGIFIVLFVCVFITDATDLERLESRIQILVGFVTILLPFTTTFLAVAIGYYFREVIENQSL